MRKNYLILIFMKLIKNWLWRALIKYRKTLKDFWIGAKSKRLSKPDERV